MQGLTVVCFELDAKMDMSHIMSGLLCLATHNICPIFDFSMPISTSVNEASRCVALVESYWNGLQIYFLCTFLVVRVFHPPENVLLFQYS